MERYFFYKLSKLSWWLCNNHTYHLICFPSAAFCLVGEWLFQKMLGCFSVLFKWTEHGEGKTEHTKTLPTLFFQLKRWYFNRWRENNIALFRFQSYRTIEVGSILWRSSGPTHLLKHGLMEPVAQEHDWVAFQYLHGWRLHQQQGNLFHCTVIVT